MLSSIFVVSGIPELRRRSESYFKKGLGTPSSSSSANTIRDNMEGIDTLSGTAAEEGYQQIASRHFTGPGEDGDIAHCRILVCRGVTDTEIGVRASRRLAMRRIMTLQRPQGHDDFPDDTSSVISSMASTVYDREGSTATEDLSRPRMPLEKKLFWVNKNACSNFQVVKYPRRPVAEWVELDTQDWAPLEGTVLRVGDLVELHSWWDPMAIAEIADIRPLKDKEGRYVLRIYWFIRRLSALQKLGEEGNSNIIPSEYRFVKTAHTQVVLWDTVIRVLSADEREMAMTHMVLRYLDNGKVELHPAHSEDVAWTRVQRA